MGLLYRLPMIQKQGFKILLRRLLTMVANQVWIICRLGQSIMYKSKVAISLDKPILWIYWIHKAFYQFAGFQK